MAPRAAQGADLARLVDRLRSIVGLAHVADDPSTTARMSGDLSLEPVGSAIAVVSPADAAEVVGVLRAAASAEVPVAARGAALSYTRAHSPAAADVLLIDDRRMVDISIRTDDLYVEVGPGCTWEQLYLATSEVDLRVPSWGPLSGRKATVGGTLSQNGAFYGAARHGTVAEEVLGLEVVLGDGRVVRTGAAARLTASAFSRYYGPDLTGLFLADSGAFGVKTQASLSLIPRPAVTMAVSFAFDSLAGAIDAMGRLARRRTASDVFAFDPFYHELLVRKGFSFLASCGWSVHAVAEGLDDVLVRRVLEDLRRAVGSPVCEIDASVPIAMRADPFGTMRTIFGAPGRQVHLPLHALLPLSATAEAVATIERILRDRADVLAQHAIRPWTLATVVGKDLLLEPGLCLEGDYSDPGLNASGREAAVRLRREMASAFGALGAVHMQIGKYYEYLDGMEPGSASVVRGLKQVLDPGASVNPGSLGLL